MKKLFLFSFLFLMLALPMQAHAEDVWTLAQSPAYGKKSAGMLGRGVINATTGFVDLFVSVVNETKAGPPLVGTFSGLGKGIACFTLRTLSGATDIATFWVPSFNGFPVCKTYGNCISCAQPSALPSGGYARAPVSYTSAPPPPSRRSPLKYVKK